MAGIPLSMMALMIVETFAFGHSRRWLFPTFVGLFEIWVRGSISATGVRLSLRGDLASQSVQVIDMRASMA